MEPGEIITDNEKIKHLLEKSISIAIVGLSPDPERDSNWVAVYLKRHGYRIIPVYPGQEKILGERAYPSLDDINEPIDIINVFRSPSRIMPHAREALRLRPKVFWMQLGIENQEAANFLTAAGIDVIMNKCIKIEYETLCR